MITLLAGSLLSACNYLEKYFPPNPPANPPAALTSRIDFNQPALYPEGVDYSPKTGKFYVSSLRFGTVGSVLPDGTYQPLVSDESLISAIGLRVDDTRNRLLVAVSDPGVNRERTGSATQGKTARLGLFNLNNGSRIKVVDLGALKPDAGHFANDIAVDPAGNAYVTDSFSPIIYKVDTQGNASILLEAPAYATQSGQFGFNGIAYHPDGYLIVAFARDNKLLKVSLSRPSAITEIKLDAALQAPDGLLVTDQGKRLIVVNNAGGSEAGRVLSFQSSDNFASAQVMGTFATGPVFPTTATDTGKGVYVLHAYLNRLFAGAEPPISTFTIQRVDFSKN